MEREGEGLKKGGRGYEGGKYNVHIPSDFQYNIHEPLILNTNAAHAQGVISGRSMYEYQIMNRGPMDHGICSLGIRLSVDLSAAVLVMQIVSGACEPRRL